MANIVITGASRGLGLEFVKQLAAYSSKPHVFALCRDPNNAKNLRAVADDCSNVSVIKADMTHFDSFQDVASSIQERTKNGSINLLVNNAGIMIKDSISSVKSQNIINSFQVNAVAPLLLTKALLPLLRKADTTAFPLNVGKSVVLNISAHLGSIEENTTGGYVSYRLSKAAVNMVTKTLAVELKTSGVFVMALHPGWVKTDMGGQSAPLTPEKSVNGMLTVLSKADETFRGYLFTNLGKKIPW